MLTPGHGRLWLNTHTPGVQGLALANVLADHQLADVSVAELGVPHQHDDRILPAGVLASGRLLR